MPQPKGHEPFSRFWTVNYKVIFKYGTTDLRNTFTSRPRSLIFGSKPEADAAYNELVAAAKVEAGSPAPGTIQQPFVEEFRNKKTAIIVFVNSHVAFVRVSTT